MVVVDVSLLRSYGAVRGAKLALMVVDTVLAGGVGVTSELALGVAV